MVKNKLAGNRKGMLPEDRDYIDSKINYNFKFGTIEH